MYKFLNGLCQPIMKEVFQNKCRYNFRNPRILASRQKPTIKYDINAIAFKGPLIWKNIPLEITNSEALSLFKSDIKQIQSLPYHCKFVQDI